jgi:hypothetical protein
MIMSVDFIPKPDEQFQVWLKNLVAYLQPRTSSWNVPQAEVSALNRLSTAFSKALSVTEDPMTRTRVSIQAKNTARKAAVSKLRIVLKAYVTYNPVVTDADRDAMQLPIHKTTHTPVSIPKTIVKSKVRLPSQGVVEIDFSDEDSENRAKPDGVHGVEAAWAILDTPPVDWSELIHSTFDTHTPLRMVFEGKDRGKTFYFALRWENNRGEKGPWGPIDSAIIP